MKLLHKDDRHNQNCCELPPIEMQEGPIKQFSAKQKQIEEKHASKHKASLGLKVEY